MDRKTGFVIILIGVLAIVSGSLIAAGSKLSVDDKVIRKDSSGFTLETSQGLTRLEVWDDHTVRVLHTPTSQLPKNESLAVIAKPEKADWKLQDKGDYVELTASMLRVKVDKTTGRVSFMDSKGQLFLAEKMNGTSIEPATVGGVATYVVEQQFEFDPQEAVYGLGQHQQGVMNYAGSSVHLQQENREVAIPVLLSSKGYALLWDNPAVTRVSIGGGDQEILPSARLLNEEGQPGGLTGCYYKGTNFEELVLTKTDSVVDFEWGQTPPQDMPHDNYSVRWTGFIEVEQAGEYTLLPSADDGVRLWIDDKQVVDEWNTQAVATFPVKMNFAANSRHRIRMEYFQGGGGAAAHLGWQLPSEPVTSWSSEAGDAVDYYVMYGPKSDKAISAYRQLTGTVPMFPKWTWGFWQCKERYKSQEELLGVLSEYRKRGIPIDGIIQDWQYWEPGQWGSHEFEAARYPDPAAMVKAIHEANAHTIISIWPRFDVDTTHLAELEQAGVVYPPVYTNVYPAGKGKWYDPFNPKGRALYWKQLKEKLAELDFDGWWMDACEAELGGDWGEMRDLKTGAGSGAKVYNAYPLMHTTGVYQGQRADIPEKRVFILARSAYAGQQRNGVVTWSGDIQGNWKVFAEQIPAGLNFSASGIPYWNTDIGGFFGGDPAEGNFRELFTRWFQFGTFCPMFRVHGTGQGKEMWRFDEATQKVLINYDRLRYHLLPYIYSVSWEVTHNDYTMMRPLVMDFSNDAKVYNIADQYMFGPAIMVNPVIERGAKSRDVYLPEGSMWYDFRTGQSHAGGQTIKAASPIETMPLFVRAGSIIPYGPAVQYADEKPDAPIELRVYPGADGSFTLYEDEGDNYNYEKGIYATIDIRWDEQKQELTIGDRQGKYPGMAAKRIFRIVRVSPDSGVGIEPTEKADAEVRYTGKAQQVALKARPVASSSVGNTVAVHISEQGKAISPDLFGIFFEDISYAADGGLYAELIQNRSFEYQATEQIQWNEFSFWEFTAGEGGQGYAAIDDALPVHPNNPHYVVLHASRVDSGVGLINPGFDGIPVKAGETYDVSLFARQLYMENRWGAGSSIDGKPMPLIVRLETRDWNVLGEASLEVAGREWKHLTAAITANGTDDSAHFAVVAKAKGGIAMDDISVFPRKTFHNHKNGLRADLAQVIADLQPKFVRFPGGCLVHGNGLGNMYRWKDTIGPIEQRRQQANLWGYHQTVGLGYFEYFQFCEDIGAKPLPIVSAGVSCQNSGHTSGVGQQAVPMDQMPAYIQDVLDLIEWANGPATSEWGAKRAAAGHPESFGLQYLGVGNEDAQTSAFRERFKMIYEAVKEKYPDITVVGTVGPSPDGQDFEEGWKFANELKVEMVDEHYYKAPNWFLDNLNRYDTYDRSQSKVYVGEYAAHENNRANTLRSALAEAAYMTSLERNGDVVAMASYAPMLAKHGHTQWNPDLIYFSNTWVIPTINYYVQKMFSTNSGDTYLATTMNSSEDIAVSCVKDSKTGDIILKLVNTDSASQAMNIDLPGRTDLASTAVKTVLAGDPMAVNDANNSNPLVPETSTITVGPAFEYEAPPHSLTVIYIKSQTH